MTSAAVDTSTSSTTIDNNQNPGNGRTTTRLSTSFPVRFLLSSGLSFTTGFGLGAVQGGKMAGLRFRAENAHRLPNDTTGWYFYHKAKNYQAMYGGVKEGLKMGFKLGGLVTTFVVAEEALDKYREESDFLSSVTAGLGTAGLFSLWNRFSVLMAYRMSIISLKFSLGFGLAQDAIGIMRGHQPRYYRFIKKALG